MIIDGRPDDALRHIVGHTQAAIGDKERKTAAESDGAIIGKQDARDKHKHYAEVGERAEHNVERCHKVGIGDIVTHHIGDTAEWEIDEQSSGEHSPPLRKVIFLKPSGSAYKHTENEKSGRLEHPAMFPSHARLASWPSQRFAFTISQNVPSVCALKVAAQNGPEFIFMIS